MRDAHITIAGAGITGLAVALAVAPRACTILEQSQSFSRIGAGIQLGPNAVRALQRLAAWEFVEPITTSPPEIHIRDGLTGQLLRRQMLGETFVRAYGRPYRVAHRADLHDALLQTVKVKAKATIQMGRAIDLADLPDTPLIAADGVNSTLRQKLFPDSQTISYGKTYHRALFTVPKNDGVHFDCVNLWMMPGCHVVHYPVGKDTKLNLVAILPEGKALPDVVGIASKPLASLLQEAIPHVSTWPGLYIHPMPSWVKNKTLLLGDAAHATLPFLAQGAAMALEDAACLKEILARDVDIQSAFVETQIRRQARTRRLHEDTVSTGNIYHMAGVQRLARNAVLKFGPEALFRKKTAWIYKH
jgi:salicylate hydroxylase